MTSDVPQSQRFTVRQVAHMTEMSPRQIRSYVSLGILNPATGPHGRFEFTFQEVIVLRAASELLANDVPSSLIHSGMSALQERLAVDDSLTSFSLVAEGGRVVVVRDGDRWDPLTGQEVLNLDVEPVSIAATEVRQFSGALDPDTVDAEEWFLLGDEVEGDDSLRAVEAYERAIELDPRHVDAHINLGRILHAAGRFADAIEQYSIAVTVEPANAIAWFNMGVALEDEGAPARAIDAYLHSIDGDASLADAHHNVAVLYERTGDVDRALQHLREYRKLLR
ncbi:MAG: tetratricopeptide repeat protein [Acidimicrobiia bacterium]